MMFLTEVSMWDVAKKQFFFKWKTYRGVFSSLMVLQVIGILFSLNGDGMSGGGSGYFDFSLHVFSGNILFAFVMIWGFISAIIITTRAYRYDDFTFVTNWMTSHLSNLLFLLAASFIGGITVLLCNHVVWLIVYFTQGKEFIIAPMAFQEFVLGIAAITLYILMFAALGYLAGMLVQYSKVFIIVLPVLIFGALFTEGIYSGYPTLLPTLFEFFMQENSFGQFTIKVVLTSGAAYAAAILLSHRMEVER
ncbi:hypothetical protein [Bacillus sp. AK031]